MDQPNIIFIFSDQQRWDTVGSYGSEIFPELTPNLDRLAGEGVRFENAFTCQPVCGPARSCIQSGRWATETGCYRNGIGLPTDQRTIAHILSEAGYEVGYIGKWHLASTRREGIDYHASPVPPEHRGGYDDFWLASDVLEFTSHAYDGHMFDSCMDRIEFPRGKYRVDCLTDFALSYIKSRDRDRPLFLFISYIEPHQQNDHGHFEGPRGSKKKFGNYNTPGDLEGNPGDWSDELPDYLGQVHSLDRNLGRLRSSVESRLGDNTVILYTSDHGCHFRTRNSEYKRSCHESSIRIPLIISGPGFEGGRVVKELVSLIDLPPTLVSLGGSRPPDYMRGLDILELLSGTDPGWREEIFVQISEDHVGRALRTARWKYSVRATGCGWGEMNSPAYAEDSLFDLEKDPHERKNLVADPELSDLRAELSATLVRRMVLAGEAGPEISGAG
jgi:uncharacterized sulfatase